MKYYLGIDGGGTKTKCIAISESNEVIFENTGAASNFLIIGNEKVSETILSHIKQFELTTGLKSSDIVCIVLGTTGAGRINDANGLKNHFLGFAKSQGINVGGFEVVSDARIALEAAFSGKPGSILICGTGSIMFGKDAAGTIHRVGGFGRYLGDEGSGYHLGSLALRKIAQTFDGRIHKGKLTSLFIDKTGIDTSEKLISEVYSNNFEIPSVAPILLEAASEGDENALEIVDSEIKEIVLHFKAMRSKINEEKLKVSFIGGIITNENVLSSLLLSYIEKELIWVNVLEPQNSPEMGAALMAKDFENKN